MHIHSQNIRSARTPAEHDHLSGKNIWRARTFDGRINQLGNRRQAFVKVELFLYLSKIESYGSDIGRIYHLCLPTILE